MLVVVAVLSERWHGQAHLTMLWFCLGMSAALAAPGAMDFAHLARGLGGVRLDGRDPGNCAGARQLGQAAAVPATVRESEHPEP